MSIVGVRHCQKRKNSDDIPAVKTVKYCDAAIINTCASGEGNDLIALLSF